MEYKDVEMLQDIPSMPFMLDFNIPVVKVTCGDTNYALLSAGG